MWKNYRRLLVAKTDEIDWGNIRATAKKIIFYCIACAGFSLNVSIPVLILLYLNVRENFTVLNAVIVILGCSGFMFLVFMIAPMAEMTEFLVKINFFRVYFFYAPKGILRCMRKVLCALIRSARLILLQKPLGS